MITSFHISSGGWFSTMITNTLLHLMIDQDKGLPSLPWFKAYHADYPDSRLAPWPSHGSPTPSFS